MRTESLFLFCITENEVHLESITGLLGSIKTQEINYNSRGTQILQLQVCAVIFNDVCEPAALLITNILTQSYAHVLILFIMSLPLLWFFTKMIISLLQSHSIFWSLENQFKTIDTNQSINCLVGGGKEEHCSISVTAKRFLSHQSEWLRFSGNNKITTWSANQGSNHTEVELCCLNIIKMQVGAHSVVSRGLR